MSEHSWQSITARVAAAAAQGGLDLVHPFGVGHYNAGAPDTERLDDWGRPNALGILIGNTRRLWPIFTRACADDPALSSSAQPLDTYVEAQLITLFQSVRSAPPALLVFAHVTKPRAFPIQRLAERVGFAAVSPSHLAIHPLHGPWLALRAVALLDVAGPEGAPSPPQRPCVGCSAPCLPALAHALALSGEPVTSAAIARHAAEWIAVRDACPVGQSSRYGASQLTYHYAPMRSRAVPDP